MIRIHVYYHKKTNEFGYESNYMYVHIQYLLYTTIIINNQTYTTTYTWLATCTNVHIITKQLEI